MDLNKLYYFHEWLNVKYFDGKLEAAIIRDSQPCEWEDLTARIETETEPFIIWFNSEELKEEGNELYLITVLLHEMVHQYNRELGLLDVDEDGEHLEQFKETAVDHGLIQDGYALDPAVKNSIIDALKKWELMQSLKGHL